MERQGAHRFPGCLPQVSCKVPYAHWASGRREGDPTGLDPAGVQTTALEFSLVFEHRTADEGTRPEPEPEPESEPEPETNFEIDTEPEPELEVKLEPESDIESESDSEPAAEAHVFIVPDSYPVLALPSSWIYICSVLVRSGTRYFKALEACKGVYFYANARRDNTVSYCTAGVARRNPYRHGRKS